VISDQLFVSFTCTVRHTDRQTHRRMLLKQYTGCFTRQS